MKIRVLQLGSPTGLYGAERWILALIKHLDPEKIESRVAVIKDSPSLEAPLCREAQKLGFRSHSIQAYGRANFSAVKLLRDLILENDIHILHTHGYKTDIVGLIATRGTRCKIISTPHGWTQQADIKLRCYEFIDRLIFPLMDAVVPLSEKLYDELRMFPGLNGSLHMIPNGVDISEIDSVGHIAEELNRWKSEGRFILGYIGRLTPGKGLDVLLRSLTRLSIDWRFALIGDGEQRQELEQLSASLGIAECIKFFGFQEDRISFLKGFDVFVLPSRSEGIPRCLMEAMAAGTPIVASDIPGCRVLVSHEKTGLSFPVNDARALAYRIGALAANLKVGKDLAQNGRELIESRFSAKRMAKDYQKLYSTLAGTAE